jgi:putative membrane protein
MGIQLAFITEAVVFSVLGLLLYAVGFVVIDKLTPYKLWHEIIEGKNIALAILIGAAVLGLSNIIAAAVH